MSSACETHVQPVEKSIASPALREGRDNAVDENRREDALIVVLHLTLTVGIYLLGLDTSGTEWSLEGLRGLCQCCRISRRV